MAPPWPLLLLIAAWVLVSWVRTRLWGTDNPPLTPKVAAREIGASGIWVIGWLIWVAISILVLAPLIELIPDDWLPPGWAMFIWLILTLLGALVVVSLVPSGHAKGAEAEPSEVPPQTRGARRCTNTNCEFGGRWIVGKMVTTTTGGYLMCLGANCHTVYQPRKVIHPESDDYRLWVG